MFFRVIPKLCLTSISAQALIGIAAGARSSGCRRPEYGARALAVLKILRYGIFFDKKDVLVTSFEAFVRILCQKGTVHRPFS